MAAHERVPVGATNPPASLIEQLATVLPRGIEFQIYHLSTPPTRGSAIYSAPPGHRPDKTYCENHFLTASIRVPSSDKTDGPEILVYAVEILIYSTAHSTTFFVSKADSTGYLHLLDLPKGTPSPIREITVTFLNHLVALRERAKIPSIISLFARAQDQYLFPGSVEYSGKHVLDDRGLVRWWCQVLDPLVDSKESKRSDGSHWKTVEGHLVVPGLDTHDMLSYIPRQSRSSKKWTMAHPLKKLTRYTGDVPPRCLIPHFPDDPKSRFLDELDDELTKGKQNENGHWKSVKTIDQFWDMMAYRQECSAGRMVGFIWIVFTPNVKDHREEGLSTDRQSAVVTSHSQISETELGRSSYPLTPAGSFSASFPIHQSSPPEKQDVSRSQLLGQPLHHSTKPIEKRKKKKQLRGLIIPRQPRIKIHKKNYLLDQPENTAYYTWPVGARGQVVVDEADYDKIHELLLRLDFANIDIATSSSRRWINEVRSGALGDMRESWGQIVVGTKVAQLKTPTSTAGASTLNMGLVRKKRKVGQEDTTNSTSTTLAEPQVNILSAGMIRKKARV